MGLDDLKKSITALFENHHIRLTPSGLERTLRRMQPGLSSTAVRSAIKEMVAAGSLLYTNHFNTTHLELNFCRPVRVSQRIVLSPHGSNCEPVNEETHTIQMDHGSAFGIGDHPTTRLALRAVDWVMAEAAASTSQNRIQLALDIGTGSGVLSMAAVKLGAERVMALDVDTLALHEARNNVRLNAMDHRIMVTADPLENLIGIEFDLIMANLRPPTLRQILPLVEKLSAEDARWVLSGFRIEAVEDIAQMLPRHMTEIVSRQDACGWAALTVRCIPLAQRI